MLCNVQIIGNIRYILLALFLAFDALTYIGISYANDKIEIVIHPNVQAFQKDISKNSLRAIFGMRLKNWSDGTSIKVFVLSDDNRLHQNFSKEKLNVFPYQLRSAWDRLVFSGTGQSPIKVDSEEEMLAKVGNTPGAIGYLWRDNIDDTVDVLRLK